jgi:hypothetical protein
VLVAYADGFVLTSTQLAVGAIERAQSPFTSWLLTSTLLLPVHLLAVLGALAFAHRRLGPALRGRRTVAAALLMVAASSLVGWAAVVGSAFYDYHLQSQQLARTAQLHAEHQLGGGGCTGLCAQLAQTGAADQRAARLASAADLAINAVLVAWVLALRGGRLDSPRLTAADRHVRAEDFTHSAENGDLEPLH